MYRLAIRCFALSFLASQHALLQAGDRSSALTVGSLVLAKHPGVKFRIENQNVAEMHAGLIKRVQRVQGEWLWLELGWVERRDVVPVWEAVEYFSSQIERQLSAFSFVARASAASIRDAFPNEIRADIDRALELQPDFAAAHWMKGLLLHRQGDFDGAIEAEDEAIQLDPKFGQAYHDRAYARWSKGECDKALKDLAAAIRVSPRLASAYATRGLILHSRNKSEEALAEVRKALQCDPTNAMAHVDIGWYLSQKGDDQQALHAYTEAIRVDRNCVQARLQRGQVYSRQGHFQQAIVDLNQAVQLMPKNLEALNARAYVYYRLGAIEKSNADRLAASRRGRASSTTSQPTAQATDAQPSSNNESKNPTIQEDVQTWLKKLGTPTPTVPQPTATGQPEKSLVQPIDTKLTRAKELNTTARRAATSNDERYLNGARSVELATEACEKTDWQRANFIDTLAAAYAEIGDFEAAIQWQTKAIEVGAANLAFKAAAEERLELYRAHQPCREDSFGRLARSKNAEGNSR